MSIIILVPFDLVTIDSKYIKMEAEPFGRSQHNNNKDNISGINQNSNINVKDNNENENKANNNNHDDICSNIIELGKFYLNSSSKTREASSVFLANFFARPDIQKMQIMKIYIQWSAETILKLKNDTISASAICGIYSSLIEIFKIGQRRELLQVIHLMIDILRNSASLSSSIESVNTTKTPPEQTGVRHLKVKLIQRIGLLYLKPRAVSWAYKMGNKSLLENMKNSITDSKLKSNVDKITNNNKKSLSLNEEEKKESEENAKDYFDDIDFEDLESIIDFLIENLRDKDTVVRWSAAKGLGRITGRLDLDMADDVVSTVVSLFQPNETESTWHGGCLTIGELSRRGLLLPNRLSEVFPIINKALVFDVN
jgi:hypothetical protein